MQETQTLSSLSKEQKEVAALLSIGTFLEFFDLMLYIHMAVLTKRIIFSPMTTIQQLFFLHLSFALLMFFGQ